MSGDTTSGAPGQDDPGAGVLGQVTTATYCFMGGLVTTVVTYQLWDGLALGGVLGWLVPGVVGGALAIGIGWAKDTVFARWDIDARLHRIFHATPGTEPGGRGTTD